MKVLTREELKELIGNSGAPAISIYMPTFRTGKEVQQNPIRLKNLLLRAEKYLGEEDLKPSERDEILTPARELLTQNLFWSHQSDGLALFVSPGTFRYYRLPIAFEELVIASHRFHIKPLLRILSGNGRFFLLAFSKNAVRLLEGTHYSVREIELPDVPKNLGEALHLDAPREHIQFHTGTGGGDGKRPAMFHGQGAVADEENKYLLEYLRRIDEGMHRVVSGETAPLLLAAVDYLLPNYAQINTYTHLFAEGITGNPDRLSEEELHDRAWPVIQPHFLKSQHDAAKKYHRLANKGLSDCELETVVHSAYYGRVESLFAALDNHRWGTFNPEKDRVSMFKEEIAGSEDLIDFAAAHTILNGGQVFTLKQSEMPVDSTLAAVLRY